MKKKQPRSLVKPPTTIAPNALIGDVRQLIDAARRQVAQAVNAGLTLLYWQIGNRVRRDILGAQRAGYGEEIVVSLAEQLTQDYGQGFSWPNLFRMIRFAEVFPQQAIVSALMRQLSWTHFRHVIPIQDPLRRDFYAEMCRVER